MTKKKKGILSYLTTPGYVIICLSLSLVVASGLMAYYYETGDKSAKKTDEVKQSRVAGKVKAASNNWQSSWQASGVYDVNNDVFIVADNALHPVDGGPSVGDREQAIETIKSCENIEDGQCKDKLVDDLSQIKGVQIETNPPFVWQWTVGGNIDGENFSERWDIGGVETSKGFLSNQGTDQYYFTGKAAVRNGKLRYKVLEFVRDWRGSSSAVKWWTIKQVLENATDHVWINSGDGTTSNWEDAVMQLSRFSVANQVMNSSTPTAWTITGCFGSNCLD